MTVTINKPLQLGINAWRVSWTSDQVDPIYRVYRGGVLIAVMRQAWIDLTMIIGESERLEVLDDAARVPKRTTPAILELRWAPVTGVTSYRIEQLLNSVWTTVGVVSETGETLRHRFRTEALADVSDHDFRVIALNEQRESTPAAVVYSMVRVPDPPEVSMTFDDVGKTVTVADAA